MYDDIRDEFTLRYVAHSNWKNYRKHQWKQKTKNMRKYIRFGIPPKNGKSKIYRNGIAIGEESGISAYDCCKIGGSYHVCMPSPMKEGQGQTYEDLINEVTQTAFKIEHPRKVFLVTGEYIGRGTDNEPILSNINILQDITKKFKA